MLIDLTTLLINNVRLDYTVDKQCLYSGLLVSILIGVILGVFTGGCLLTAVLVCRQRLVAYSDSVLYCLGLHEHNEQTTGNHSPSLLIGFHFSQEVTCRY